MIVHDVTPILNVSNLQESFAWFEQLGWKKHWEHGDPPNFGAVISGHSEIFLCQGGQGARGGPMPRRGLGQSRGQHLDDLVAAFTRRGRRSVRARPNARSCCTLAANRYALERA